MSQTRFFFCLLNFQWIMLYYQITTCTFFFIYIDVKSNNHTSKWFWIYNLLIITEDLRLSDQQNKYSLVSDKFDLFEEWSFCETIVWLLLHVSTEKKRIKWFLAKKMNLYLTITLLFPLNNNVYCLPLVPWSEKIWMIIWTES